MLLDSNVIIYAAKPEHPELRRFIAEQAPAVSAVSYVEVLGYHGLTEQERRYFEMFFAAATVLPVSDAVVEQAVRLRQCKKMTLVMRWLPQQPWCMILSWSHGTPKILIGLKAFVCSTRWPLPKTPANFNTSTPGANAFTVNASGLAGNTASATNTYSVQYNFSGFLPPLADKRSGGRLLQPLVTCTRQRQGGV